jgi:hypothetical protein
VKVGTRISRLYRWLMWSVWFHAARTVARLTGEDVQVIISPDSQGRTQPVLMYIEDKEDGHDAAA